MNFFQQLINNYRIWVFIAAISLTMAAIRALRTAVPLKLDAESIVTLGFILIVAYLFGKVLAQFRFPKITGFLLAGILAGPFVANLLSAGAVGELRLLDNIALALIALTAGGELHLAKLREQRKIIGWILVGIIISVMAGFTVAFLLLKPFIPFLSAFSYRAVLGTGLIIGVLSISASPATTIAVITETKARGKFTEIVLSVTIAIDLLVVLLFALVLAFAKPLILPDQSIQLTYLLPILQEIVSSLAVGAIVGVLIFMYLRTVKTEIFLFLMGIILLVIEISQMLHLEIILLFITAGFVVQNFSPKGSELIHAIENRSLPIYVIFFGIAGASIDFSVFLDFWIFTLLVVLLRFATIYWGTFWGASKGGAEVSIRRQGWSAFAGQAGVTLGLAIILEKSLGFEIGTPLKSIILAGIALNQIIGPVVFRYALEKAGNIPEEGEMESDISLQQTTNETGN